MNRVSPSQTATLLVSCPARKGLGGAPGQRLYGHGVNIIDSSQHSDLRAGQFFQRISIDLRELHTDRLALERAIAEVAERFAMRTRLAYADRKKRVAIMVSQYDHCLLDLLWRQRAGELRCELPLIVGNHAELAPLVESYG